MSIDFITTVSSFRSVKRSVITNSFSWSFQHVSDLEFNVF